MEVDLIDNLCPFVTLTYGQQEEQMTENIVCTCYDTTVPGESRVFCLKRCVAVLVSMAEISDHVIKKTT